MRICLETRGANADPYNPAHTDGCDPDDAVQGYT